MEDINFNDPGYASTMLWIAGQIQGEATIDRFGRINNGRHVVRQYGNVWLFGNVVPRSYSVKNIYDEVTIHQTDMLIDCGYYEPETRKALYYGAYTPIELQPAMYLPYEIELTEF